MNSANNSHRAAFFVFVSTIVSVIAGVVLYFVYSGADRTAVPLLIGCVLVAALAIAVAARIGLAFRRSAKHTAAGLPRSRALHVLDLRQWLILLLGLGVVAIGTGAFTGLRVLGRSGEGAGPVTAAPVPEFALPQPSSAEPEPEPTFAEPSETVEPRETVEPTDTVEPTETVEPSETPESTESPQPAPGSTKYLDNEEALEGGYEPEAVAFAAERYSRGVTFACSSAASSALQWNVAGSTTFEAVAGIDDNTRNTFGKVVEFLFYDQDGRELLKEPAEVSMGRPQKISLPLTGVTSLRMTCATRDAKSNEQRSTQGALGDPVVVAE